MDASLVTLIVGLLGGGTVATLVQFFVKRKDGRNDKLSGIEKELRLLKKAVKESEADRTRSQLLIVMYHQPENIDTILTLGEKYFNRLGGNWFMDAEFQKWLDNNKVPAPSWFNNK